jgi:hypothetical protein
VAAADRPAPAARLAVRTPEAHGEPELTALKEARRVLPPPGEYPVVPTVVYRAVRRLVAYPAVRRPRVAPAAGFQEPGPLAAEAPSAG